VGGVPVRRGAARVEEDRSPARQGSGTPLSRPLRCQLIRPHVQSRPSRIAAKKFFVLASFVTVLVGGSCNSVVRLLQSPACRCTCGLRSREPKAARTPEVTASLQQRSRENVQHVLAE
jgi:hypothetical protein